MKPFKIWSSIQSIGGSFLTVIGVGAIVWSGCSWIYKMNYTVDAHAEVIKTIEVRLSETDLAIQRIPVIESRLSHIDRQLDGQDDKLEKIYRHLLKD